LIALRASTGNIAAKITEKARVLFMGLKIPRLGGIG
jgi:hypothetical protein